MNAGRASILSIPKTAITRTVSNVHRLANDNDEAIVVIATMMVRFVLSAVGVSRKKSLCQNSVMGSRLGHHYIQVAERINGQRTYDFPASASNPLQLTSTSANVHRTTIRAHPPILPGRSQNSQVPLLLNDIKVSVFSPPPKPTFRKSERVSGLTTH